MRYLQAAVSASANTAHFFRNGNFLEFDFELDRVSKVGALDRHGWRGLPGDLDAAVVHENGRRYFFRGSRYYRTEVDSRTISDTFTIDDQGWDGVPRDLDAAVTHPTNHKIYFFKGSEYWRFDIATNTVDRRATIGRDGWKGVPHDVDCAILHPVNQKAYFFKGAKYYRFDFVQGEVDFFGTIGVDGWIGLDQWPNVIELNIGGDNRQAMAVCSWRAGDAMRPAVYYFHGNGGDMYDSANRRRFHQAWPESVVVYAEGTDVNSSGRLDYNRKLAWQVRFPYKFRLGYTKDIEYVLSLTREVESQYEIDPERCFASGHSSGGFFTLSLMDLAPHLFTGFAALGCHARYKVEVNSPDRMLGNRARPLALGDDDIAPQPRPVLYMFGDNDTSVGGDWPGSMVWWDGDTSVESQKTLHSVRQLLVRNRCGSPSISDGKWSTADTIHTHPSAQHGAPVSWAMYQGGHSWPKKADKWAIDFFKSL